VSKLTSLTPCRNYIFWLMLLMLTSSCRTTLDEARLNPYVEIKEVVLERVLSGIPSEYITYRLYIDLEVYKATYLTFDHVEWGSLSGEVFQLSEHQVITKVDIRHAYGASERVKLIGSLFNIHHASLPETIQEEGNTLEKSKLYLIMYNSKGRKIRIDLGNPDKVNNFLAE
jgi:hypothetical protein